MVTVLVLPSGEVLAAMPPAYRGQGRHWFLFRHAFRDCRRRSRLAEFDAIAHEDFAVDVNAASEYLRDGLHGAEAIRREVPDLKVEYVVPGGPGNKDAVYDSLVHGVGPPLLLPARGRRALVAHA